MTKDLSELRPFHLALPVADIEKAIDFYHHQLGFPLGRQDRTWVDINFYGHQLVFHKATAPELHHNEVDSHEVPVPHFGIILEKKDWLELSEKIKTLGMKFEIDPYIRFEGFAGEQGTFFFYDPNGLALEFKTFADLDQVFAKN